MKRIKNYQNRFIRYYSILLMVVVLPYNSAAQVYTLDEVLNKIEERNPSLQAFQSRVNAINESANGANAWAPPKAGVGLFMFPYNFTNYGNNSAVLFSVTQDFPNQKENAAKEDFIKSMSAGEQYSRQYFKVQLFANAKETFNQIYMAKRRIAVLDESTEALKLMINLATKQLAITKGNLASVYRLKARLAENETTLIREQNTILALIVNLNFLMDEDVNSVFDIDTSGLVKNYSELSTQLKIDSVDLKRSDILKITSDINTMRYNQQYISLRSKPEFGVNLQHMQRVTTMPNAFSVMGTMTIPSAPWSAKSYKSVVRALDFQIESAMQEKKNRTNMAEQKIKGYLIALDSRNKELTNYTTQVIPAYQKSLDANLLAYGQNTNDMNMTLLAWDDLLRAQMQYLKNLNEYLKVQTEYEKELEIR